MRLFLLFVVTLFTLQSQAQFANDWVDYSRQYWKFQIAQSGIYKVTYSQLLQAGFPVNTVNPSDIRFYARGQEVDVRAHVTDDGSFDVGDYFEIYALKNDGWLDAQIYTDPTKQANAAYSLFNDTAQYFITFTPNSQGARTQVYTTSTDLAQLSPSPYVNFTLRENYNAEYQLGKQDVNGISLPWYEEGEGWSDTRFPKGQTRTKNISTASAYTQPGAPNALIEATSMGASLAPGSFNHHLQVGYGSPFQVMVDTIFYGYQLNKLSFEIPTSQLSSTTSISHRSVDDIGALTDFNAIASIQITYPRLPTFAGSGIASFKIPNFNSTAEGRLDLSGINVSNPRLFVGKTDLIYEIPLVPNGNAYSAILPFAGSNDLEVVLTSDASIIEIQNIKPVTQTGYFTNYAANPVDSAFLMITHHKLMAAAQAYAFHRESQGLSVVLTDIDELYMQYGYGIAKHPLAIRNFCRHLIQTWPSAPSHLFIVGKSIHEMKISNTVGARDNIEHYESNLVPSWGYPTSDIVFTSGLGTSLYEPAIPTGRLAANNEQQLQDYLVKVVQFENQPPAAWKKRVLHFGGGGNAFEQGLFSGYLDNYQQIVQDTCFGGDVYSFYKTTTEPIQLNMGSQISELINGGVSLMTFFGHASSTGFDINIDSPADYNNEGKYPLLIGNSCYTGNIHLQTTNSASEVFVLAPNAGTIGFIAKPDLGAPTYLNIWTENFYRQIFQQSYGASIGQCMQRAVQAFQTPNQTLFNTNTILTFSLHGDPALVLNSAPLPDYSIEIDEVLFSPENVTNELETFDVQVVVNNIGKATNTPFSVELIRHLPNGIDTSLVQQVNAIYFRDTITFTLPIDPINGIGLNLFDVYVDYPSQLVDELNDISNNIVSGKELLITSGNLIPVYPYNFAIEPNNSIVLKANTGNPFAVESAYQMQLDTVDTFDSPFLQTFQTTQIGGVIEWPITMSLENNVVYFWRAAAVATIGQETMWRMHSFQYVAGETGWGQAHFDQFKSLNFSKINYNENQQTFDFETGTVDLKCTVYGLPADVFELNGTRYQIDLEVMEYGGCGNTPALHVAVLDPITLEPWQTNYNNLFPENDFGNLIDCTIGRNRPEKYFIFRQNNAAELEGMIDMLNNHVPDGHHILIYTWRYANYDGWDLNAPSVYNLFNTLGSTQIGQGLDSVPFIYYGIKGNPSSVVEQVGTDISQLLEITVPLSGSLGVGNVVSPTFGPSSHWDALYWEFEQTPSDSAGIRIVGLNPLAQELLVTDALPGEVTDLETLLPSNSFSNLRLRADLIDPQNQTPPQLKRWQLLSDHAPECALNPLRGFYFPKDTIQQGEPLPIAIAIENIGAVDMDSLLVGYRVIASGQEPFEIPYPRSDSLRVGEVLLDTAYIDTHSFSGALTLRVEANKRDANGNPDQMEQYAFNNIAELRFFVVEDKINPLLDVTFDGRHILNGELVSPTPLISALLDDENPYFLLSEPADTANFKVFITHPSGIQYPVYFSDFAVLNFVPATGTNNRSQIQYTPRFEDNGTYRLLVQARDKSGNTSGDRDYRIDFEVNTKPSITEVVNYPNPFSTRTQFVFTITGTQPPDEMLIRIMTVSGAVVREIRADELGPLRIGNNRTEFWWDGTDMFGDRLANGIYLYTVQARLRGQDLDLNAGDAAGFFTKGVGKMYLLR
ncbi:MAG: hypothetical protein GC193_08690 [Cryomorphaceae bacterium]|nr:hypothetical protein [Cryomorphaceae bacterium]